MRELERIPMSSRNAGYLMAKALHEFLQMRGRERFILDDQDIRRFELVRDFVIRDCDQRGHFVRIGLKNRLRSHRRQSLRQRAKGTPAGASASGFASRARYRTFRT